ncbi:MAG TPA: hypothetical protein VMT00_13220 [Thermoanaerobaculia bacterium]|nr:hypothetical protein [Thermoanaerobaculia bacterium]
MTDDAVDHEYDRRTWPKIPIFGLVTDDAVDHGYDRRTWPKIPIFGLVTDDAVDHGYKLEGGTGISHGAREKCYQ